jgi:hypothetical protein
MVTPGKWWQKQQPSCRTVLTLNETSLENAIIEIAAFTDERGLLIAARPRV